MRADGIHSIYFTKLPVIMSSYVPRPVRYLIVEDNYLHRKKLEQMVVDSHGVVAGYCADLDDFNRKWPEMDADVAIVDLQLGLESSNRDGWMVLDQLANPARPRPVLIRTGYNQFDTWRKLSDYPFARQLGKGGNLDDFIASVYPLLFEFYPDAAAMFTFHPGGNCPEGVIDHSSQSFRVKHAGRDYPQVIDPQYINFVEGVSSRSMIRIFYKTQQIEFSSTLDNLLVEANYNRLLRINRSTIINANYIDGCNDGTVHVRYMGGTREFSISKNEAYATDVCDWFKQLKSGRGR